MADRYWVGGTGTWDSTSTTNWSTSSGGAGGASVPTAADNVIFDAGSDAGGIFTVTMANSPRLCNDFTASGLDFTMTLAGASIGLTVSGSLEFPATNFTRTYTGATTFNATTTGKTITTNGVAFGGAVTLNGVGGEWTLGSAISIGNSTFLVLAGTFDTSSSGNYAITAGVFGSNVVTVRTINLNASTITLSGGGTVWGMSTTINATLNAGSSTINLSSTSPAFQGGGLTYYNVSFTSTAATFSTKSITGANTFNNLTFSTIGSAGLNKITVGAGQTINGTLTINGANGNQRQFILSDVVGTSRTLTCAAIAAMTDVDFRDITIAGAHGTLSGTRLGDCGGNTNITFDAGVDKYWNLAAGGNWNANAWATSSGGGVATTNYPLPQDTAIIENTGLNTSATITINSDWNIGTLDTSTRTNAMTLASLGTTSATFYGNFTYGSGVTPTGTSIYTFSNRATKTLNSGGITFTQSISLHAPGGGIQLLTNNLTLDNTRTTALISGTLDLNNLTLSTGIFSGNFSFARSIAFGTTGSIVLTTTTAASKVLSMATATGFTFTGTSNISAAMFVTRTFEFGTAGATASNRLNINLTSGASVPTFTGSFRQINFTGSTCNPGAQIINCHGFTLASGGTYTSTDFITVGDGTLTSNGKVIDRLTVNGSGITTTLQDALTTATNNSNLTCTLTLGTLDLNGFTLTTSILSSSNTNTRSIAFGSTGSIVLAASVGRTNLSMATATNFTFTGTSNISAAMSVTRTFSFGFSGGATASNRLNINLTSGASVPTFTGSFRQINFTGSTCNPGAQIINCHGFTLASGGTYTSTDFITVGDGTLTYTGKAIDILDINAAGITTTLADAGQIVTTTLRNGTLDLAGFTLTCTTSAGTGTGTKNLTFNGGTLVCSAASATAWNNAAPTGFTTTAGTGTGTISMTAATAKTFVGGGSTYNCTLNQGGAGTLTITGANTFNDITNTEPTANQITFPDSTTNTFNNFTLSGTSGNLVSLRSSTPATQFTLSKSSGTVSVSYLDIQDSNATGGATWNAFTSNGNVDSGNNLGWDFSGGTLYAVSIDENATSADAITLVLVRIGAVDETATGADTTVSQLDAVAFIDEGPLFSQATATLPVGTSFTGSTIFDNTSAGGGLAVVANGTGIGSNGGFNAGGNYVLFSGANTRSVKTITLDLTTCLTFNFSIIRGNGTNGGETPDVGENIVVEYSTNGGGSYTTIDTISSAAAITTFTTLSYSMPVGAKTASTIIRWRQAASTQSNFDQYGIRNFVFGETGGASAADTIASQLDAVGAVSETATGADTTVSQLNTSGAISETATGVDTTATTLTRVGAVLETATGADTTNSQLDAVGAVSETATGADTTASQLNTSGAVSETATGADAPQGNIETTSAVSETATGADTTASQLDAVGAVSETATGADIEAATLTRVGAVDEAATGADTEAATLTRVGAVDETATGADTTASQLDAVGAISETATAADALTTQLDGVAVIDETAIAEALAVGNIITTLQISEGATILDESLIRLLWELINDNQLPGWQVIQNAQGTGWTVINTNTGTSWNDIDTI
jgi:hypothetical protein